MNSLPNKEPPATVYKLWFGIGCRSPRMRTGHPAGRRYHDIEANEG